MTALETFTPFDSRGLVRRDLETIDTSRLSPERLALWSELVEAAKTSEAAEADFKAKQDAIAAAVKVAGEARDAVPKATFHDLWLATVKGIPMPE